MKHKAMMYSEKKYDPHFFAFVRQQNKEVTESLPPEDAMNKLHAMYVADCEFFQKTGIKNSSQEFRDNYDFFKKAIVDDWFLKQLGNSKNFKINSDLSFQPISRCSWRETILLIIGISIIMGAGNFFILGESILSHTFIIGTALAAWVILSLEKGSYLVGYYLRYLIKKQMALRGQERH